VRPDRGRIQVRLSDFLKTGNIGPIGVGSTRAEVVRAFGPAMNGTIRRGTRENLVWYYGPGYSVEFGFNRTKSALDPVYYVQVENADDRGGFSGADRLHFFDEGFRVRGTMKWDIERFCRIHRVRFVQIRSPTDHYGLLTEGGVCAWAGDEDTEGELFFGFQTFITDGPYWAMARHMPVGFDRLSWRFEQLKWKLGRSTRRRRTL
jgi:hypothetical protein